MQTYHPAEAQYVAYNFLQSAGATRSCKAQACPQAGSRGAKQEWLPRLQSPRQRQSAPTQHPHQGTAPHHYIILYYIILYYIIIYYIIYPQRINILYFRRAQPSVADASYPGYHPLQRDNEEQAAHLAPPIQRPRQMSRVCSRVRANMPHLTFKSLKSEGTGAGRGRNLTARLGGPILLYNVV